MSLPWQELIAICIFIGVAIVTYGFLAVCDPYWIRVNNRVRDLRPAGSENRSVHSKFETTPSLGWFARVRALAAPPSADDSALVNRMTRAGFYHPSALSRYLTARVLMTAVPFMGMLALGLAGYLRMDKALLAGCVLGGFGAICPGLWVDRVASRRHIKLRAALPDFLDLMVVCLEGGLSLQETIRRVGDELRFAHPILASELITVQRDVELGATIDQSLKRFAQRSDYDGIRTLSTFIRETQRFGTNITEALRSHAESLRTQRELAAEEAAQKASVKILLPTMFLIFPAVFVVLVGPAAIQIYQAFGAK
jgi:tight adherence protein C